MCFKWERIRRRYSAGSGVRTDETLRRGLRSAWPAAAKSTISSFLSSVYEGEGFENVRLERLELLIFIGTGRFRKERNESIDS